jgi:hypothetical protein
MYTEQEVKVGYPTSEKSKQIENVLPQKNKILVVDIKYITTDLKSYNESDLRDKLEDLYGYFVFLIDSSRQNLQGDVSEYNNPPIYFA